MIPGVVLACPVCRTPLEDRSDTLECPSCRRRFPVVAGIPDLRTAPDPWIDLEADRAKALRVLEEAQGQDFEGHVRTYWRLTPTTDARQAEQFVQHVLAAGDRTREWLSGSARDPGDGNSEIWLDIGCGTADLATAVPHDLPVIGIDIAMRWLVVARKRLEEAGRSAYLVCANAEALPFQKASFTRAFALGTFEHCQDLSAVAGEAARVLVPGGGLSARTTNRFSLLREPHVGLWGVGFMPRRMADRYVRWRGGQGYEHHYPPSVRALRKGLRAGGLTEVQTGAARTLEAELKRGSVALRLTAPLYEMARRTAIVRRGLAWIAPILEADARTPAQGGSNFGDSPTLET